FVVGLLGNIVSIMLFFSPMPIFYRIVKQKSTEGFSCMPYTVALFSAMLWLFYGLINTTVPLVLTINAFGCAVETVYIVIFIVYANRKERILALKMVFADALGLGSIVIVTMAAVKSKKHRVKVVGWISMVFATLVFVAPLSVMRKVIQTRSAEFLPITLSVALLLVAIIWFVYGFLLHDVYIMAPNILGFMFAIAQIILYVKYRK
ncbi:hypothetical protein M569_09501, partial [Genlisea aurea]